MINSDVKRLKPMTNKERNELAYKAFWCTYDNPEINKVIFGNKISISSLGRMFGSIKIVTTYYLGLFKCTYLTGHIDDFEFEIDNKKEVAKVKAIIDDWLKEEQELKDKKLKGLAC